MVPPKLNKLAVWAVTPNGVRLADRLAESLPGADIYVSFNLTEKKSWHIQFEKLSGALEEKFGQYSGHIFIMSTGIVVRVLAPLIQSKTSDPAVVVADDLGINAISLLSGHIGGANELTYKIAHILKANPVITTATDINGVPAIDVLAIQKDLVIENPDAIKTVNMAFLKKETILLHDPFNFLTNSLLDTESGSCKRFMYDINKVSQISYYNNKIIIYIDDVIAELPSGALILRPPTLVAGIGCNRDTDAREISAHLAEVLESQGLASSSLKCLASIEVKNNEAGLIEVSESIGKPLVFFTREELNRVKGIKNPSTVVEKHVGVKSVCEAAAILASRDGTLIVPKASTQNVTVAIARINFLLSE
ncbi:MAG: cobalt-precorrin 5A hydrolase [Desulfobacteraceae bacterium]|jgi:cobalt-precorrin 5A hydrolase|nr:cobalt-precorrin 5A hydrolase [Desulfobacteraceae bacterium]